VGRRQATTTGSTSSSRGHENGGGLAYVTRINLDVADPAHRITLLTPVGPDGKTGFSSIDGSTWNPHTQTLLFTQEAGSSGGVIEITPTWPPVVRTLDGVLGRAGYEGIHPDDKGNLLLAEDVGGTTIAGGARQPNSFVYRFVPVDSTNLSAGGQLQALQVTIEGHTLRFNDPGDGRQRRGRHAVDVPVAPAQAGERLAGKVGHRTRHRGGWLRAIRRQRQGQDGVGDAVQASGERAVPSRFSVQDVLLRRDR
jgi:hypothetical protein